MKTSRFLNLNFSDLLKGLLTAILSFLAYYAQDTLIPNLGLSEDLKIALSAAVGYLIKNFFTPQKEVKDIQSIGLPKPPRG